MNETKQHVLVVDDEASIRGIVGRWLGRDGYRCLYADGASMAMDQLRQGSIHAVTLDIDMPGTRGIDLLPDIKQEFPDVEVVMLTGSGQSRIAIEALTHGAFAYLMKPVERDELVEQVRKALRHRRLTLENRMYTQRLEDRVRDQTVMIRCAHEETIYRLVSASMYRDEETGAHIRRVGLLSEVLARAAGWSADRVDQIRLAGSMHDVGKIGIPDQILLKPNRLTVDEFEIMKTHTVIGSELLSGSDSPILELACEIARSHHERWDGSGYPDGRIALDIPESARIVSIADVYDALMHRRVYRPAMSEEDTLEFLREGQGTQFDPQLLDLFFEKLPTVRQIVDENPDGVPSRDNENWSRSQRTSIAERPETMCTH